MKFLGKMSLMTILKVKKPGLHHLSEKCLFGKTTGGRGQIDPPVFLGLRKLLVLNRKMELLLA